MSRGLAPDTEPQREPLESELLELHRTLYTSRNPTRRWLHETRRDWITDALRRVSPQSRHRALEVGFGSGIYLSILAELFDEVVATDVEEIFLRNAGALTARWPNLKVVADDITCTKLPTASFDLVLCSEVIEHLHDSASAMAGIHSLLHPGGTLVLSTPQRWSILEMLAKVAFLPGIIAVVRRVYNEPVRNTQHINLMTADQVTRQLERAGFHILERDTSGMYLPLVAEFGGPQGMRLERWLESALRDGPLRRLLWTQYYIARA